MSITADLHCGVSCAAVWNCSTSVMMQCEATVVDLGEMLCCLHALHWGLDPEAASACVPMLLNGAEIVEATQTLYFW